MRKKINVCGSLILAATIIGCAPHAAQQTYHERGAGSSKELRNIESHPKHLAKMEINGLYGFVDLEKSTLAIPPAFDDAHEFYGEAIAPVKVLGKWGYINTKGNYVISPKYDYASNYKGGNLPLRVAVNGVHSYIDRTGNFVWPTSEPDSYLVDDGHPYVRFKRYGKYGAMNMNGVIVIEPKFEGLGHFTRHGPVPAKLNRKWGFVTLSGEPAIPFIFDEIVGNPFNDSGLAGVKLNGKYGAINTKGEFVIEPIYDSFDEFYAVNGVEEHFATVRIGELKGTIDSTGKIRVPIKYEDLGAFTESGLAGFTQNGVAGFLDTEGKVVIDNLPYSTSIFYNNGLAIGSIANKNRYIINTDGNFVATGFEELDGFMRPYYKFSMATKDGKTGFVNTSGEFVVYKESQCGSDVLFDRDGKAIWPVGYDRNQSCR